MSRVAEAAMFVGLAASFHLGVWTLAPGNTGAASSGAAGADRMSLAPASAGMARRVQQWDTPPETLRPAQIAMPVPAQPAPVIPLADLALPRFETPLRPALPSRGAAPSADLQPPPAPDIQRRVDTPPAPPSPEAAPRISARPEARPSAVRPQTLTAPKVAQSPVADSPATPRPVPKERAAASAQPKKKAKGAPSSTPAPTAGQSGQEQVSSSKSAARAAALHAKWGARIQSKVHRSLRYPKGASGSAVARIALTVDRAGRLTGLRLVRSSGQQVFDAAALNAVKRAGRFPRAPRDLTDASYSFTLALRFQR